MESPSLDETTEQKQWFELDINLTMCGHSRFCEGTVEAVLKWCETEKLLAKVGKDIYKEGARCGYLDNLCVERRDLSNNAVVFYRGHNNSDNTTHRLSLRQWIAENAAITIVKRKKR